MNKKYIFHKLTGKRWKLKLTTYKQQKTLHEQTMNFLEELRIIQKNSIVRQQSVWLQLSLNQVAIIIIIIMVILKRYFSGELIALSLKKILKKNNNNGVNIELGKTNRSKVLFMMQNKK